MNKLIFSKACTDKMFAFNFVEDKLDAITYCNAENIVGNIYVGIVSDIVKNINAAFIGFSKGLKGYYLIDDNSPLYLNPKNTDKMCQGDRILVQVSTDKVKTKEYTLTSNITITGEYAVLTVGKTGINISKKIKDNQLRKSLKDEFSTLNNSEYGFIIRTSCMNTEVDIIKKEVESLIEQWENIKKKAMHLSAGSVVKKETSEFVKLSLNAINGGVDEIITDDENVYSELILYLEDEKKKCLRLYNDSYPLHKLYNLEKYLRDATNKKVWLNSGAYVIIEHTEALTVIDVNTGKAEIKGNREEVFLRINREAANAIARELRIRNISGIIIIDFISMINNNNNYLLIDEMKRNIQSDDITTTVVGFTKLGLMEITRKRVRKPILEILNEIKSV